MRILNSTHLPVPLVEALRNDDYNRGEGVNISATGLLSPPRKQALEEMYAAELEEDAADLAAILIGKGVHAYIAAKAPGELSDKRRLMMAVNGWVVSGQTDHVDDEMYTLIGGRILDYKTTSVNEWKFGLREERAQQLNIYAEIFRSNGLTVTGLAAVLVFKDYSATQGRYAADYPPHSIVEMDVPLWSREEAQAFILERVKLHQAARCGELPDCTDDERWLRDNKWSVRKRGNTRATKNHDTEADAIAHATELNKTSPVPYTVEAKMGEPLRCSLYCAVGRQGLCSQYNAYLEENNG